MSKIQIDVWSDIACPWCWIGKRHLAAALELATAEAARGGGELPTHTRWHAFELDPTAPREVAESVDYAARLARKYGTDPVEAQTMIDRMVEAGEKRGVTLRFDRIRPSNTFDAHRLLAWAGELGAEAQDRLKERLFRAYLGEGRVMADVDTLVELAGETGLDPAEAESILRSERYAEAVRLDEQRAAQLGIRGVPSFVVAERFLLTGAQPPELLAQTLARAWAEGRTRLSDDPADDDPADDSPALGDRES